MTIVEKVPSMSNEHLANLLANARRIQTSGLEPQRASADEVAAAAEAELAVRRSARLEALAAKRAASPRKPPKAPAVGGSL